jgi:hypothetical protein
MDAEKATALGRAAYHAGSDSSCNPHKKRKRGTSDLRLAWFSGFYTARGAEFLKHIEKKHDA